MWYRCGTKGPLTYGIGGSGPSSAPVPASEDFGSFGAEWHAPSVFWYIGGTDPDAYDKAKQAGRVTQDIPTNHSPNFAPVIHPTLETGVEAMVVAARAWLSS